MTTRVALVDDYEIVRRGLHALLDAEPDLEVVAEVGTCAEALGEIPLADADVALVDVRLPDGDGVELCRDLTTVAPDLRCLLLTAFADDTTRERAAEAGAYGLLLKALDAPSLVDAVREVAAGETLPDTTPPRPEAADDPAAARLTPQERRVVALLSEGLTNRRIGEHLGLSEKTVKNYVSNVLAKLHMAHRSEVAVYGARLTGARPESFDPAREADRACHA